MNTSKTTARTNNRQIARATQWRALLAFIAIAVILSPYLPQIKRAAASEATAGDFNPDSGNGGKVATAGDLDPSFGNGGKVITDFAGGLDEAHNVVFQSDGKIIVAGDAGDASDEVPTADFALARYNADGSLDASFGKGGKVTTDFEGNFDQVLGMAIQRDGKVVAVGYAKTSTGDDWGVARYNSDGSLDASFGKGGKVTTDFANNFDTASGAAIQSDGRIVVGGFAVNPNTEFDFALVRYNSDGSLDTSFGKGGKVTTDFANSSDNAPSVAIQSDGKIIAIGRARTSSTGFDMALARYNIDGSLDESFGKGGKVTTDFGSAAEGGRSVAIQSDGRIVVAGYALNVDPGLDFALARYNIDGSLDVTFGSGGKLITDVTPNSEDAAQAVAIQSDGRIIAAGNATITGGTGIDFALVRYNADGSLDTSFGKGGKLTTDFGSDRDWPFAMAIQKDGNVVVVGRARNSITGFDFALARYQAFPFDICIQDNRSGHSIQFNSQVGDYRFVKSDESGFTLEGRGRITRANCTATLIANNRSSAITAQANTCQNTGRAKVIQPGRPAVAIVDSNIRDNTRLGAIPRISPQPKGTRIATQGNAAVIKQ